MGVFNPAVEPMRSSKANIWVQNGPASDINSIEVGWAADNFQTTGCYNVLCPGFVQIDSYLFLGQAYPLDLYHSMRIEQIAIFQDNVTGNWWLITAIESLIMPVGYWPKEIFTYLALGADVVKYGATTSTYIQQLDSPPMGSGKYPEDLGWGYGFFLRIRYVNESYNLIHAEHSKMIKVLNSICYGLMYYNGGGTMQETMKFGGPGGTADKCKQLPPQQRN
ncbi:hypothetical protein DITRI_Ditri10aG0029000 [Diplodiscus trichospermus]